uniref:Uncharacterized protein n=2 Tax=Emiliania huxleyi TaxID=2903 RepID=A0A7S3W9L7_EMIHU|mmetsp:Transcript_4146/g.12285  ORF Transcript_4146/g.12285 Transcript_4146/m.12285 type:complete len:666 (-) Transcript_4146:97-2094(-)
MPARSHPLDECHAMRDIEASLGRGAVRRGSVSGSESSERRRSRNADTARSQAGKGKDRARTRSALQNNRHGYWLLLILFLCGPLGTLLFFVLLPPDTHSTDETGPYELGTKIVHLALAGSSRRARYVLDEYTVWGTFLAGVRDRLQCGPIRTVTDSSGEAILAVADMVDHDHIVIHADWSGGLGEAQASDGGGSTLVRDRRSGSDGLLRLGNSTRRRHRARSLPKLIEQVDALQAQGSRRGVSPEGSPELTPVEPCGARHPTFRLAMVVPWVTDMPPWITYFVASARRSSYLADFLVFHEMIEPPEHLPDNVRFIDLGVGGLSQLIGLRLGDELGMPVRNASLLIRSLRFMLDKWPRLVAEYKPAFGTIFEQYLGDYSHWGYCDLDMVAGNLPLFIERAELAEHDIVTYSWGDVDALYLRGQWTVHRNARDISTLWKGCPHLGSELQKELLLKVAWVRRMESKGMKSYPKRFQSAEGCYSHAAAQMPGIRIKMAHKQFVGLSVPSEEVVYVIRGAVWQCPADAHVSVDELAKHSQQPCSASLPGVQEALGTRLPLRVSSEGCGKWMPVEYRMCASLPEPPERERDTVSFSIELEGGQFYAQRFRTTLRVLDNGCRQGAFFHMQEWKKLWDFSSHGVDPLELSPGTDPPSFLPSFTISTDGVALLT